MAFSSCPSLPWTSVGASRLPVGRCRSGVVRCFPHTYFSLTTIHLFPTMSLLARTPALRLRTPQIIHSRAIVPSRGVHGYKVCFPLDAMPTPSCSTPGVAL